MHPELEGRQREKRHRRLAVILGLLLALFIHLFAFWGPRIHYRPLLEEAKGTRVIRARPYEREVAPAPKASPTEAPEKVPPTPSRSPAETPPQQTAGSFAEAAPPPEAVEVQKGGGADMQGLTREREAIPSEGTPDRSEWASLMAEIEAKSRRDEKKKWEVAEAPPTEPTNRARSAAGKGEDDGAYLDPRIRMSVVSYPPTSIEKRFTPVPFPDVRVTRKRFTEGICRVYYRVRTDGNGKIVRREFKTPATKESREHFAPFVDVVVRTVEGWTFEREAADIHVDVYFDLANL